MSDDMVESVARAILRAESIDPAAPDDGWAYWCENASEFRENRLRIARAAIAAMREPTEAMCDAAFTSYEHPLPRCVWVRMIDAALGGAQSEEESVRSAPS